MNVECGVAQTPWGNDFIASSPDNSPDARYFLPTWFLADGDDAATSWSSLDAVSFDDDFFSYSPILSNPEFVSASPFPESPTALSPDSGCDTEQHYSSGKQKPMHLHGSGSRSPPKHASAATPGSRSSTPASASCRRDSREVSPKMRTSTRRRSSGQSTVVPEAVRSARACHNQVEKKYRIRLNVGFERLLASLLASARDEDEGGAKAPSKAAVLDLARRRIRAIEAENHSLRAALEQSQAHGIHLPLVAMAGSSPQVTTM